MKHDMRLVLAFNEAVLVIERANSNTRRRQRLWRSGEDDNEYESVAGHQLCQKFSLSLSSILRSSSIFPCERSCMWIELEQEGDQLD